MFRDAGTDLGDEWGLRLQSQAKILTRNHGEMPGLTRPAWRFLFPVEMPIDQDYDCLQHPNDADNKTRDWCGYCIIYLEIEAGQQPLEGYYFSACCRLCLTGD